MPRTPLPLVPGVVKVVITNLGTDGRKADNVIHLSYGGGPPSSIDCQSISQAVWDAWEAWYTATQPAQTSLTIVTTTDLSTDTGGEGSYDNTGTPLPGTSTHGMLPLHTAFLLSKFVEQRYQGGHPRSYLPIGTTNDMNDDGDWKTSSFDPWVANWSNFIEQLISSSPYGTTSLGQECAVSYYKAGARREVPLVMYIPLDGYSGSAQMATQRRRVRKTARHR